MLLMLLGVTSISSGLYYQTVNATTTNYSFSSDYFEFANDTVACHNCTAYAFNDTYNATPPGCCEHDVNTTINGLVSESKSFGFVTREVDNDTFFVVSMALVLFGLGALLDTSLQMLQARRNRRESEE